MPLLSRICSLLVILALTLGTVPVAPVLASELLVHSRSLAAGDHGDCAGGAAVPWCSKVFCSGAAIIPALAERVPDHMPGRGFAVREEDRAGLSLSTDPPPPRTFDIG